MTRRVNWGQAAGEALLILLGILLALAADAWWEERSERRQEQEYLEAMAAELEQMRAHVDVVLQGAGQTIETAATLLEISPDLPPSVTPDSLSELLSNISMEVLWSPPTAVYEDLVNTGAVGLIRAHEVRLGLNELMESVSWVQSRADRHNEFFWTEMDPYFRRHLPVLAVFGWDALAVTREEWIPGDFIRTEEFRNLIAVKGLAALDVRDGGEELTVLIEELAGTVEAALEGS